MDFFRGIIEDAHAIIRGDKRLFPRGTRGRIFKGKPTKSDLLAPKGEPVLTLDVEIIDGITGKSYTPAEWKLRDG